MGYFGEVISDDEVIYARPLIQVQTRVYQVPYTYYNLVFVNTYKLDGVGPVDNSPPPTSYITLFEEEEEN